MWRRCIDAHREHSRSLKRCICHGMFVHRECLERTMVVNREPESICLFAGINPGEKTYIIAKDQHTLSIWHGLRLRKARCRRTHCGLLFFKYIRNSSTRRLSLEGSVLKRTLSLFHHPLGEEDAHPAYQHVLSLSPAATRKITFPEC